MSGNKRKVRVDNLLYAFFINIYSNFTSRVVSQQTLTGGDQRVSSTKVTLLSLPLSFNSKSPLYIVYNYLYAPAIYLSDNCVAKSVNKENSTFWLPDNQLIPEALLLYGV